MCPPTVQYAFQSVAGRTLLIMLLCCPVGVDSRLSSLFSAISLSYSAHHLAAITSWRFPVVTKGLTGIHTYSVLGTGDIPVQNPAPSECFGLAQPDAGHCCHTSATYTVTGGLSQPGGDIAVVRRRLLQSLKLLQPDVRHFCHTSATYAVTGGLLQPGGDIAVVRRRLLQSLKLLQPDVRHFCHTSATYAVTGSVVTFQSHELTFQTVKRTLRSVPVILIQYLLN